MHFCRIVGKPVIFPPEPVISPDAQSLIRAFCTIDRSRRLGNLSGGVARVKEHPFFAGVDWDGVYHRRERGPILPPVRWPGDAQCFDYYPEDEGRRDFIPDDEAGRYEQYFEGF